MTASASGRRSWSRRRWAAAITLAIGAQLALVFWAGDKSTIAPRGADGQPQVLLAPAFAGEWADAENPTLFARASRYGFSGQAWLRGSLPQYQPAAWTEPAGLLQPDAARLTGGLRELLRSNAPPPLEIAAKPEPRIGRDQIPDPASSLPTQSVLRVAGGLAGRRLLSDIVLPSQPHGDLLTNSVVQVIVDADGGTRSATLLSSCGSAGVDQQAIGLAKSARFESLRLRGPERTTQPTPALAVGSLVFQWHTVPLPATNAPPARP
jgi:TonB family protein